MAVHNKHTDRQKFSTPSNTNRANVAHYHTDIRPDTNTKCVNIHCRLHTTPIKTLQLQEPDCLVCISLMANSPGLTIPPSEYQISSAPSFCGHSQFPAEWDMLSAEGLTRQKCWRHLTKGSENCTGTGKIAKKNPSKEKITGLCLCLTSAGPRQGTCNKAKASQRSPAGDRRAASSSTSARHDLYNKGWAPNKSRGVRLGCLRRALPNGSGPQGPWHSNL